MNRSRRLFRPRLPILLSLTFGLALMTFAFSCDKQRDEGSQEPQEQGPPPDPYADLPQHPLSEFVQHDQEAPSPLPLTADWINSLPAARDTVWGEVPTYTFRLPNHPTENAFDMRNSTCGFRAREDGNYDMHCILRADPNQLSKEEHLAAVVAVLTGKYGEPQVSQGLDGNEYRWPMPSDSRTAIRAFTLPADDWGYLHVEVIYRRL